MAYGEGAAVAAARARAIAQAIKASGAIVRVEPNDFISILNKTERPLVVMAKGGVFKPNFQYLTAYKGLIFYCKTTEMLQLPASAETIFSKKIWIPG